MLYINQEYSFYLLMEFYVYFGWDRMNYFHSGWYVAMFWIGAEHRVDNLEMF